MAGKRSVIQEVHVAAIVLTLLGMCTAQINKISYSM